MNQAIITKHTLIVRAKNKQKIFAQAYGCDRLVLDWDADSKVEVNHAAACYALASRMGWTGEWRGGKLPQGGYCWVRGNDGLISV